ncbi:SidA/IucD/PvdA family monooxygenase [Bacillus sp. FJAT-29937]|uniref:SidA/IucD/PvdA family monooxygenase n=1 Tax=Bacillus sp. FJAT-29937 TaxID=1720553 RepID=UPI0008339A89
MAVGLGNVEFFPSNFQHLPAELISHSSGYTSYESFAGKRVVVLGGGQSGWEAAALLHQAGANVELAFHGSGYEPPLENINERQRDIADKFFFLPEKEKDYLRKELLKATVTEFLLPLVEGKVRLRPYSDIICAKHVQETGKFEVVFRNEERVEVDHLFAATGYCPSVDKIMFLKSILPNILKEENGFPVVNFESSVEGLYFVGPLSSHHHGPTYTQIAGVWHTSRTIISSLLKQEAAITSTREN